MKQRAYEGLFLLDSNRATGDMKAALSEIEEILKRVEAEILMCCKWDERRLAYDIRGHRKGSYVVSYFRASGQCTAEIERRCRLSPLVLRSMILQIPEKHLEDLMARVHAPRPVDTWDRRGGPGRSGDHRPAPSSPATPPPAPPETPTPTPVTPAPSTLATPEPATPTPPTPAVSGPAEASAPPPQPTPEPDAAVPETPPAQTGVDSAPDQDT